MYTKVVLTLLLLAMIAVAVGQWSTDARHQPASVGPRTSAAGEMLLRQRVSNLDLRGVTRLEAVRLLYDKTHANLVIDWPAFGRFPFSERPVLQIQNYGLDGYLENVSLLTALKAIFGSHISCQVDGSIITVTGTGRLDSDEMMLHAYDVSDLVSDDWWGVKPPSAQAVSVHAARMERVRDIVTQHTENLAWHDNYIGSGISRGEASISVCGSCLMVTQSTDGQMEIADVLAELRRAGPH